MYDLSSLRYLVTSAVLSMVLSHGVNLKSNQKVNGCSYNIFITIALIFIVGRLLLQIIGFAAWWCSGFLFSSGSVKSSIHHYVCRSIFMFLRMNSSTLIFTAPLHHAIASTMNSVLFSLSLFRCVLLFVLLILAILTRYIGWNFKVALIFNFLFFFS